MQCTEMFRTHPPPHAAGVQHFFLDDAGSRPDRLAAVSGPQERVQRRIVEQIVVFEPGLPVLDVSAWWSRPCPRTGFSSAWRS